MEQNTGQYDNPYKFNGKELDEESGLYYYGARYYNPRLSIWYGVDPLAEKMPGWSPYAYAFDNPVNFVDPDGREPFDWVRGHDGKYFWDSRVTSQASAEYYYGKGVEHIKPYAMGYPAGNGSGYVLLSDNAKWVQNAIEHTAPDMANENKFNLERWISHLGNTGGDFNTGMGGAQQAGSSPFHRPEIDKVVNTEGYFGAILNSLGIGAFNPKMDRLEALLGLSQQAAGLADSVPSVIGEQKNKSIYGTLFYWYRIN